MAFGLGCCLVQLDFAGYGFEDSLEAIHKMILRPASPVSDQAVELFHGGRDVPQHVGCRDVEAQLKSSADTC